MDQDKDQKRKKGNQKADNCNQNLQIKCEFYTGSVDKRKIKNKNKLQMMQTSGNKEANAHAIDIVYLSSSRVKTKSVN